MYRQLGYFLYVSQSKTENNGISEGELAPAFDYLINREMYGDTRTMKFLGKWTLLIFVDPLCAGCERALHALDKVKDDGVLRNVTPVVVTSAEHMHRTNNALFSARPELVLVDMDALGHLYRVKRLPFAFVIDPTGVVRAKGGPETSGAIRRLLNAVDLKRIPLLPLRT
jgi:thioredoxin-related protein